MNTLSSFWAAIAPALGDHLWQSTLLALVAGLLTLLLQRNHARARYWLWLAASLKFLVPFSWLVAIGSRFAPKFGAVSARSVYVTVEQVTQPFTQSPMLGVAASSAPSAVLAPASVNSCGRLDLWLSGSIRALVRALAPNRCYRPTGYAAYRRTRDRSCTWSRGCGARHTD
jgi:hypothetical protein